MIIILFELPSLYATECPIGCEECDDIDGTVTCREGGCYEDYQQVDTNDCIGKLECNDKYTVELCV